MARHQGSCARPCCQASIFRSAAVVRTAAPIQPVLRWRLRRARRGGAPSQA